MSYDNRFGKFRMKSTTRENLGIFHLQMTVYALLFKNKKDLVDLQYNATADGNYHDWIQT